MYDKRINKRILLEEDQPEKGEERYNKLVKILLDKNDYTTLKKVTVDSDFRQKMFEHYGL